MPRTHHTQDLNTQEKVDELFAFLKDLKNILKANANIDVSSPEDLARLKIYYPGEEPLEVCATEIIDVPAPGDDIEKKLMRQVSPDFTDAERDAYKSRSFSVILSNYDSDHTFYNNQLKDIEHLYEIMQAAKEGRLMATLPGQDVTQSHPIIYKRPDAVPDPQAAPAEADPNNRLMFLPDEEHAGVDAPFADYRILRRSPHANNAEYTQQLQHFHETFYAAGILKADVYQDIEVSNSVKRAITNGLSKQQYIDEAASVEVPAHPEMLQMFTAIASQDGFDTNVPKITPAQQQSRKALSDRARRSYADYSYEVTGFREILKNSHRDGAYSQEEFTQLALSDRDTLSFLLDISTSPAAYNRNVDRIERYLGKSIPEDKLNSQDPKERAKAVEAKKKLHASVFNEALKSIVDYDYSVLVNLTDEELVEKWPEIGPMAYKISISKLAIEGFLKNNPDNPYVDDELVNKALEKEQEYINFYASQVNRLRMIAHPNYSVFPMEQLDSEVVNGIVNDWPTTDLSGSTLVNFCDNMHNHHAMAIECLAVPAANRAFGLPLDSKLKFYDAAGNTVSNFDIEKKIKGGEPVFAASLLNSDTIHPIVLDRNTGKPVVNDMLFYDPKYNEAKNLILPKVKADFNAYRIELLDNPKKFGGSSAFFEAYNDIFDEAYNKRNMTAKNVYDHIESVITKEPPLSKEEFHRLSEQEPVPSSLEIKRRKQLTLMAHRNYMDYAEKMTLVAKNSSYPRVAQQLGITPRHMGKFLLHWETGINENRRNEEMLRRFAEGPDEVRKQIVIERFREYQRAAGNIFDQPMTDEFIVANCKTIRSVGMAMGAEYVQFMNDLEKKGITFDPEIKKEMDAFHQKVDLYQIIAMQRLDTIMSPFYRYNANPGENLLENALKSDNGVVKAWAMRQTMAVSFKKQALGRKLRDLATNYAPEGFEYITDGNLVYPIEAFDDFHTLIAPGAHLYLTKKGSTEVVGCTIKDADFPFAIESVNLMDGPNAIDEKDRIQAVYEIRRQAVLQNKKLDENAKKASIDALNAREKHALAENNREADEAVRSFIASNIIKLQLSRKDLTEEDRNLLISGDVREDILSGEEYKDLFDTLLRDPNFSGAIETMSEADALTRIQKTYDELENRKRVENRINQYQLDDINADEIAARDLASPDIIARQQKGLEPAVKLIKKEFFLGNKFTDNDLAALKAAAGNPNSPMTVENLEKANISSIALSMMLTKNISLEDALNADPAKAAERKAYAEEAIKTLAKGDLALMRNNLITGLSHLNDYIDRKLGELPELSYTQFTKPENNTLTAAIRHAYLMMTCFNEIQKKLPEKDRFTDHETNLIIEKTTSISKIVDAVVAPVEPPKGLTKEAVVDKMAKYVISLSETELISQMKYNAPDGTPLTSFYPSDKSSFDLHFLRKNLRDGLDVFAAKSDLLKNIGEEDIQRIMVSMADDTFKQDLGLKVERRGGEPAVFMDLEGAIQKALLRRPMDLTRTKPVEQKQIRVNLARYIFEPNHPDLLAMSAEEDYFALQLASVLGESGLACENAEGFRALAASGAIRKVGGEKFALYENPVLMVRQLKKYYESENSRIVMWNVPAQGEPQRLGHVAQSRLGDMTFAENTPDRGNDYTQREMALAENAEPSEELIRFLKALDKTLKKDAQFDSRNNADCPRLKIAYDPKIAYDAYGNAENAEYSEPVNALDKWTIRGTMSGRMPVRENDNYTRAENDIKVNHIAISDYIQSVEAGKENPAFTHQFYHIMEMAKEGKLLVTKPRETLAEAHPLIINDEGEETEVIMAPNLAEAEREGLDSPLYSKGAEWVQHSALANDRQYADELAEARVTVNTKKLMENPMDDQSIITAADDAYSKHIDERTFLGTISNMPVDTSTDIVAEYERIRTNDIGDANPNIPKIAALSPAEKQQRKALSAQARRNYYGYNYEKNQTFKDVHSLVDDGTITEAQYRSVLSSDRDSLTFLLHLSNDPEKMAQNREIIKEAAGFGIDEQAENAAQLKKQHYANVVNRALRELNEFDFDSLINISDEELAERWKDIYPAIDKLSIFKKEIGEILEKHPDNEYIDYNLVDAVLEKEAKYDLATGFNHRMKIMANPYYEVFKAEAFASMSRNDYDEVSSAMMMYPEMSTSALELFKSMTFVIEGRANCIRGMLSSMVNTAAGAPVSRPVYYFDQNGDTLDKMDAAYHLAKGEPIFACANVKNAQMRVITNSPDQLPVFNDALLTNKKFAKKYAAIQTKMTDFMQADIENNKIQSLEDVFHTIGGDPIYVYDKAAPELIRKNKDVAFARNMIRDYLEEAPSLTPQQFFALAGANRNRPLPTEFEIRNRRALTEKAHLAVIEFNMEHAESHTLDPETVRNLDRLASGRERQLTEFLLMATGPNAKEVNQNIANAFVSGDKNVKKTIIEDAIRRHLQNSRLFDQPLTDEYIVDHWNELRATSVTMGMEYNEFMVVVKKLGIELSPELKQQADDFHDRVYDLNDYLLPRMSQILGKYYQYSPITDMNIVSAASANPNQDVKKWASDTMLSQMLMDRAIANVALKTAIGGRDVKYDAVIAADGKVYAPEDTHEYGPRIRAGEPLVFIKNGVPDVEAFEFDANTFPPVVRAAELPGVREEVIDVCYNYRKQIIDRKSGLSAVDKKLEKLMQDYQREFVEFSEDPQHSAQEIKEKKEEAALKLAAAALIQKRCKQADMDAESAEILTSEDSLENTYHTLADDVQFKNFILKQIPADTDKMLRLNADQLTDKVTKANVEYNDFLYKQSQQARTDELDAVADRKIQEIRDVIDITKKLSQPEFMFSGRYTRKSLIGLRDNIPISGLTVDRRSAQALTLAMMLKKGYSVQDAFGMSANAISDRAECADEAMKLFASENIIDSAQKMRDLFIYGLENVIAYVDQKTQNMTDFTISGLMKPENAVLISAVSYLKDFSQEYNVCEGVLPENLKDKNKLHTDLNMKFGGLAWVFQTVTKSINIDKSYDKAGIKLELMHYLEVNMNNASVNEALRKPENANKSLMDATKEEFMQQIMQNQTSLVSSMDQILADNGLNNLSEEDKKKVLTAIADDTLKDDIKITRAKQNGRDIVKVDMKEAIKKALLRKPSEVLEKQGIERKQDNVKLL